MEGGSTDGGLALATPWAERYRSDLHPAGVGSGCRQMPDAVRKLVPTNG